MNIKDIAKLAGVGVATVSRVINNQAEVKEETRKKVLEVIEKYNYIPNNSARNLKRTSSKNIGVLVDSRHNPFFYEIMNILGNKIHNLGYSMILKNNHGFRNDVVAIREFVIEKKLAGIICVGLNLNDAEEDTIKAIDIPIVVVSSNINTENIKNNISSLNIDDFQSAYLATKLFIDYGHREIGIISAKEENDRCGSLRLKGYKKALEEYGIEFKEEHVEYGTYDLKSGYEAMERLIKGKSMPSAVFIISDIMAIGAMRACNDNCVNISKDVSIIGFDGIEYGEYVVPSLSTVKQPFEHMANESVDLIMELINNKSKNKHLLFQTEIIERESLRKLR